MERRRFLKLLISAGAAMGCQGLQDAFFGPSSTALAAQGRTLVVIFLRGGCDGLNMCVPYGDGSYYQARPTIAVPPPGSAGTESCLDLNGFFGFHPAMTRLHGLYGQGRVALFPAVHYPDATRSHFDSEIIVESGSDRKLPSGWLNRYLQTYESAVEPLRAVSIGTKLVHALKGQAPASVIDNLSSFGFGKDGFQDECRKRLRNVLETHRTADRKNLSLLANQGILMLDNLDLMESLQRGSYEPENGANYPGGLGRRLLLTARLIKSGIGIESVCIDMGGWDTHSNQAGRQASRLKELSDAIGAFYTDLGPLGSQVLTLVMTEFGRTVRENGSRGTDHGNASAWMAVGAGVKGGIYGTWPGLEPENLYLGRYLAYTIDYRNILAEVLAGHLGFSSSALVLPDFTPSSLGFLA